MSKLSKPNNDHAKALYILMQNWMAGVSMAKVLTQWSPTFYKFQTRLLEIEDVHKKLNVSHTNIPYTDKITGRKKHYTQYTLLSPKPYVMNLYNKINSEGLKHNKK